MQILPDLDILAPVSSAPDARGIDQPHTVAAAPAASGEKRVLIETYGCQMNVADSELVASILGARGYGLTEDEADADVVLINTCAIREKAEDRVRGRLARFRAQKKDRLASGEGDLTIGVLGCMAERLRTKLLDQEKLVDLVVGPDAYRDLPRLLEETGETGQAAVNVQLSREETYADLTPVRYDTNGVSAFVSIMRGCDNMCAFCVVPFTRGRERSRPVTSILAECAQLVDAGYKEITVLGQNVNSYHDEASGASVSFAELLYRISRLSPELRVRYSTSHPKDCSDELLHVHREVANVCDFIHLPVQHGNTDVLRRMRRTYTREHYLDLIDRARAIVPGVTFSTDIIAGFCGETPEEHADTLSLMERVQYDHAFMFFYSERPDTFAARKYEDDVPEEVKKARLSQIIALQNSISAVKNDAMIGRREVVLVEGTSKRSDDQLKGRTDGNHMVVFDRARGLQKGDYAEVLITGSTSATLFGDVTRATTLEAANAASGEVVAI
ncbi:tRNA (N6-isopentenyl adenosine(37)-C2)-methylthiotransferase MiaB [Rubricoccus marinus]|uniref:tRNA-2-methylthio-N(6)-dimethylallyladenosine synthase n=1 Tax=Rubricoccus marinus TaxID=716817 RepID=A0A259U2R1_9BACT|nr:tRNA (N6-isopentenyl adenosine(37)-C2)-methylthiotransferase MiaB [Rubricoccus marinus]OZC04271.1 tRNA (N6-isopentenyl adenosine(37)-C2)-methylthiotransferase MiaB [Rubricoccus marinus]